MNKGVETSDTALWRQAIEICESLSGLEHEEVFAKLKGMSLQPALLEKIHRILSNMSASNPLLDQHDYQSLMDNLKQGSHLVGQSIDGYHITQLIAKGGMSTVYEAYHEDDPTKKSVALKLLSPYGITEKAIELFEREQYILSNLSHPSIVAFHHSGVTADGTHYMVMEYLENSESITDYCSHQNFSQSQLVDLVKELCQVFQYAHDQQVIHRDIKSANILMTKDGKAKVIDFGIGRLEVLGGHTVTQVFTPDMAAPEQLLGTAVDNRSDVFSLGALLLQLLTKQKPLPKANLKNYHPHNDVKHINQVLKNSDLGQKLKNIIKTAMHTDPALRYQSMTDFAVDLDNWLNHKPIHASSDSMFYRIKGLYRRNKMVSTIAALSVVVVFVAWLVINNLEQQKQKADNQRNSSFALLEAMIDQANPVTNNDVVDSDGLVKNLNDLARSQAKLLESDDELYRLFYQKLGALYNDKGLYNEALISYQKALTAFLKYGDEKSNEFFSLKLTIAHLLETTGKHAEAQTLAESLLKQLDQEKSLAPKHRLNAYYLLSKVHQYQADNETALAFGQKAIAWIEQHPEIEKPLQASVYNSTAVTSRNMGQIEQAEQLYLKAIDILRPIREKHIELSSFLVNLAILKGRSGDMVASEKLFLESFDVIKNIDEEHPHLAMNYLPYTTLLQLTGRTDEAAEYVKKAIVILEKTNQTKHLTQAYMKYARIGLYQFDPTQTLTYLNQVYPRVIDIFGYDHPENYDIFNMAMWVLMLSEHKNQALEFIQAVDDIAVEKAIKSREYTRYQMQKAFVLGESFESDFPEAVMTHYQNKISHKSLDTQIQWLNKQQLTHAGYSDILDSWLVTQLAVLNNQIETINTQCDNNQQWAVSSNLTYKVMLIQLCLTQSQHLSSQESEALQQLVDKTKNNLKKQKQLINQLIEKIKTSKNIQ